jgi:dTDP-glucose pyrophosphorylase
MDLNLFLINEKKSSREALKLINKIAIPNLAIFVVDEHQILLGTISDGDIRRGLLNGLGIDDSVSSFMNKKCKYFVENLDNFNKVKEYRKLGVRFIPLVENSLKILNILDLQKIKSILPVDAIIMAGGRGERLKPLTDNTPKPMLMVGEKPIIVRNLERLRNCGVKHFHFSLRYLGDQIKIGLEKYKESETNYYYIFEEKPLGTIGSVKLIRSFYNDTVLLMNSDLLTNIDFEDFYQNFLDSNSDMLVATVPYHIDVPYAVMDIDENQQVLSFKEKPRFTYYSNAGIYLIKRNLFNLIPDSHSFDATHFMEAVISSNYKLNSYQIHGYWLDIGRLEDYNKAQEDVKHVTF